MLGTAKRDKRLLQCHIPRILHTIVERHIKNLKNRLVICERIWPGRVADLLWGQKLEINAS